MSVPWDDRAEPEETFSGTESPGIVCEVASCPECGSAVLKLAGGSDPAGCAEHGG